MSKTVFALFLEVTGVGGSGKSIFNELAKMLAGEGNTTAISLKELESVTARAKLIDKTFFYSSDQESYIGDGAELRAIKLALHRYYQLPHSIRKNKPLFEKTVKLSIQQAKFKKIAEDLTKKERIKELANFSIKHERLLAKINIYTVSEFQKIGAIHSYVRLKKLGVSTNVELLWTLCAALKNKHASLLTEKEKSAILTKLNVLLAANGLRKVKV
ncbi:TfoX/Sxy family protein [Aggregatibacter actinomycetemcomitans]|uniref:TfoX/Sxy family protein n=1 Tax=Aggregatibacter actinomycetemcomitans TaxID=714 RepID=UPI0021CC6631|nr:TfoX/Sxy family DNA transformation protein [Aggregatibacter actinomycetemcomitans]